MKKITWLGLFIFGGLTVWLMPAYAQASAGFKVSPSSDSYKVGDTVTASILVDTGGDAINAGEGTVTFSSDRLEYQSVSTSGSIFTFWTSGPTGGSTSVSFGGGLSNPGYNGSSGKVITVTWKAKATGDATVGITGSKILANDGAGTNIYGSSSGATYSIGDSSSTTTTKSTPAPGVTVTSSTHVSPDKWYTAKTVIIKWQSNVSVKGYSYVLDSSPLTDPSAPVSSTTSLTKELGDGVYYLHVKGQTDSGFTRVTHFRIQIDTKAPQSFTITINQEGGATNPTPKVSFEATDEPSGIDHYEGSIDGESPFSIKSGDALPKKSPGTHALVIKAFDKAGNTQEAKASYKIEGIAPLTIIDYPKVVGLLSPITFRGKSLANDTVVIYLNSKEIDRFVAKDKKVAADFTLIPQVQAAENEEIIWEYTYNQPLPPGTHSFQFRRIDANGAESELTTAAVVQVATSTVTIGKVVLPTKYVVATLVIIILILLGIIFYLLRKMHGVVRRSLPAVASSLRTFRGSFSKKEQQILKEVDKVIPNHELSSGSVADVKRELKQEIRRISKEES